MMNPINNVVQNQDVVSILGVSISNFSMEKAVSLIELLIQAESGSPRAIYIANAHTLNLAVEVDGFRDILNSAFRVLGDGTGVRWAARQRGVRMKDNLVGTDLIPRLFENTAGKGYRYFLLGADENTIENAADSCKENFSGWDLAGFHHGYVHDRDAHELVKSINGSKSDLLLVGMGNPKQEQWINRFKHQLNVKVVIGVGGLFDHWGGNLNRAPRWISRLGLEWLQILLQQPQKKWQRYLIGNPKFLWRIVQCKDQEMAKQT